MSMCTPCKDRADADNGCKVDCGDRGCTCQHTQPWEQGEGAPEYIDALPKDDPRRVRYEQVTGRTLP